MPCLRCSGSRGVSLVELTVVVMLIGTAVAAAVPTANGAVRRYRLMSARHQVASEIRSARLRAVTTNRVLRVRLNCPNAGQFRVVEFLNNATIDAASNRCSQTDYPFPDPDSTTVPDQDGPLRALGAGASFLSPREFDLLPTGRVTPVSGSLPLTIAITDGYDTQTVVVTASGQVRLP